MAKLTPAAITYIASGGKEQTIDFHAVVSEEHSASATITKYPVQTGVHISTNSIRHNREISIQGVISNYRMENGKTVNQDKKSTDYGADSTAAIFDVMEALVNSGAECKVVTNLGIYEPVVFKKFGTKQKEGLVDSMLFTISGEEVVKITERNYTAPIPLSFTEVIGPDREVLVDKLASSDYYVDQFAKLSKATANVGENFIVSTVDKLGVAVETSFISVGVDPNTEEHLYEVHPSFSALRSVADKASVAVTGEPIDVDSLVSGLSNIGKCLISEATDVASEYIEDTVETAIGDLKESVRGYVYDTISMGNSYGQSLASAGIGCVVRGVTGDFDESEYIPGESLPTTDSIIDKLQKSLGVQSKVEKLVSFVKIESVVAPSTEDIASNLVPVS